MNNTTGVVFTAENVRGCYIAIKNDKIHYVGRTTNLLRRFGNHQIVELREISNCDCVLFISMADSSEEEINRAEYHLIRALRPRLNVRSGSYPQLTDEESKEGVRSALALLA